MPAVPKVDRRRAAEELWRLVQARLPARSLRRVRGLLDVWSGARKPTLLRGQRQRMAFMPELPTTPWLDPDRFGFAAYLRRRAPRYRAELLRYLRRRPTLPLYGGAKPTDDIPRGWRSLELCASNTVHDELRKSFPETFRLIARVKREQRYIHQLVFLELQPGNTIPAHVDPFNYLASVHLGLVVPEGVGLAVRGEARAPVEGDLVAFDNSFVHSAWNRGASTRLILSVHSTHPALTLVERNAIAFLQPYLMRLS